MARIPSMVSCAEFDPLGLARRQRERERIKDELIRGEVIIVAREIVDPPGHLELAVGSTRHALLVDGQCDDARPMITN